MPKDKGMYCQATLLRDVLSLIHAATRFSSRLDACVHRKLKSCQPSCPSHPPFFNHHEANGGSQSNRQPTQRLPLPSSSALSRAASHPDAGHRWRLC